MPADETTPVTIGRASRREPAGEVDLPGDGAEPLGRAAAGMLRHLISVLDREDRLESGSGDWLAQFRADEAALDGSVLESVLRTLRLAADSTNFRIIESLAHSDSVTRAGLAGHLGLSELSVSERVGDLVSAGLAVKVSEANQIAGTPAGVALAGWIHRAVAAGVAALGGDLR